MQLSEAIRLGSLIRQQAFQMYFFSDSSCALGAAAEAVGVMTPDLWSNKLKFEGYPISRTAQLEEGLRVAFPALRLKSLCPELDCSEKNELFLYGIITHLNDQHHWSRERIADFVQTLEKNTAEIEQELHANHLTHTL